MDAKTKKVKVTLERTVTFVISGKTTDAQAIAIAKSRLEDDAPIGMLENYEEIKKFDVYTD